MSNPSRGPTLAIAGITSLSVPLAAVMLLFAADAGAVRPAGQPGVDWGAPEGQECVECHMTENPGLYLEWNHSQHGQNGVNWLDCHQAEETDIDAFRHGEEQFISIVVTPKDCSKCHQTEFEQMDGSHHAKAGQILGSLDNLLGEVIGGPAAVNGCWQCHGSEVKTSPTATAARPRHLAQHRHRPHQPRRQRGFLHACHSRHRLPRPRRARPTPAANVTWAPIIRRSRSTTNPSTASPTTPMWTR